jgi:hypothetical protein
MIEKGQGLKINKLCTIQLIKVDMQLLIRVFMSNRNVGQIEVDERVSKYNYGSRKSYSIKTAILEKRLIYDYSRMSGKQTVHNFTNLKSCYDQ